MTQHNSTASRVTPKAIAVSPRPRIRPIITEPAQPTPAIKAGKSRSATFKKADVARAISTAAKAGFVAGSIEVTKDGTIRIYASGAEPTDSLFDQWADRL
jgi:hypothetical protein